MNIWKKKFYFHVRRVKRWKLNFLWLLAISTFWSGPRLSRTLFRPPDSKFCCPFFLPTAMYYTQINFVCLQKYAAFQLVYVFWLLPLIFSHKTALFWFSTSWAVPSKGLGPSCFLSSDQLQKFQPIPAPSRKISNSFITHECMRDGRELGHQTNYKPVWANYSIIKFLLIEVNFSNWCSLPTSCFFPRLIYNWMAGLAESCQKKPTSLQNKWQFLSIR